MVLVEAEEIGAVETEEVEEEMIGVEEAVAAVVMMKGADVEEEEVGAEDAVTTVNIKNKKNINSRMIIEMEALSMVLEPEMLQTKAPLEKLSFTIIRPTRKNSP